MWYKMWFWYKWKVLCYSVKTVEVYSSLGAQNRITTTSNGQKYYCSEYLSVWDWKPGQHHLIKQFLKIPASSWGRSRWACHGEETLLISLGACSGCSFMAFGFLLAAVTSQCARKKGETSLPFPWLGDEAHTHPMCCHMPDLLLLPLRFPWGQDVPWSPSPVYYLLSAPACSSPFLGWPSPLPLAPDHPRPRIPATPWTGSLWPLDVQLQHFYSDQARVKTGLEEATEAAFSAHLMWDWRHSWSTSKNGRSVT